MSAKTLKEREISSLRAMLETENLEPARDLTKEFDDLKEKFENMVYYLEYRTLNKDDATAKVGKMLDIFEGFRREYRHNPKGGVNTSQFVSKMDELANQNVELQTKINTQKAKLNVIEKEHRAEMELLQEELRELERTREVPTLKRTVVRIPHQEIR